MLSLQEQLPFAVVGSDKNVSVGGKAVLGRKNRWGVIEGILYELYLNAVSCSLQEYALSECCAIEIGKEYTIITRDSLATLMVFQLGVG
jgi:hypothetical protein